MDLASARLILDEEAMVERFALLPGLGSRRPRRARLRSSWIKPGRHFNGHFELELEDGSSCRASAFALGEESARRIARRMPAESGAVASGLLLQHFPFDYRLPHLPTCLDPRLVLAELSQRGGAEAGALELPRCADHGYRPGIRCQIRYELGERVFFGKTAVEHEPGSAYRSYERVHTALSASGAALASPRPLAYLPALHMTLVAALPGTSLYDRLRRDGGALARWLTPIAEALGRFHRLVVPGVDRLYQPTDEIALIESWTEQVAAIDPSLSGTLHQSATRLRRDLPPASSSPQFVHRDFYDKQILIHEESLAVLDLDTACLGDAEIDVANLIAHIELRRMQYSIAEDGDLAERLVAAYPAPLSTARLDWYRRTTLLRLACNYALRPRWQKLALPLAEASLRP